MKTFRYLLALVALTLLAAPSSLLADDLFPPPWRIGVPPLNPAPHSYMAKFDVQQIPGFPAGPTIEMIGPSAPYPLGPVLPTIDDISGGGLPLTYLVELPNFIDPLPLKLVRVQYSWFPGDPTGNPNFPGDAQTMNIIPFDSAGPAAFASVFASPTITFVDPTDPLGTRLIAHRYDDFEIRPNPDFEQFEIAFFDADPRWIIIDTISIPEPASVLMLGLAGVAVLGVRRLR